MLLSNARGDKDLGIAITICFALTGVIPSSSLFLWQLFQPSNLWLEILREIVLNSFVYHLLHACHSHQDQACPCARSMVTALVSPTIPG